MKLGVSNTIPTIVNLPGQGGLPPTPVFSTKALEFDGTDDYVGCGYNTTLQPSGAFTVSGWIYIDDLANNNVILANNTSVGANGYVLWITAATTNAIFTVYTGSFHGWVAVQGTTNFVTGQWYHVAGTYAGTSADMNIYVNGQLENTVTSSPAIISYTGTEGYIGKYNVGRTEGKIDEVALFGSVLGAPVIDSIFNLGVPTDLTSLSPIAWWRCGENATYKSPQILMPENNNVSNVSNYSMEFDGNNDIINVPYDISLSVAAGNHTLSYWIKTTSTALQVVTEKGSSGELVSWVFSSKLYWGGANAFSSATNINDGSWKHICLVADGAVSYIYINGLLDATGGDKRDLTPNFAGFAIGARAASSYPFDGSLDEISLFNEAKSIGDLWNGSGKPTDLTSESGLVSWWRMGEEAIFDPTVTEWTIPDQIGSNDGTSANMDIYTRVGDAPDSLNNALSYNMNALDIVPR